MLCGVSSFWKPFGSKYINYHFSPEICNFKLPLFDPSAEMDGNLASLDCFAPISTDCFGFTASEESVTQCLHPDFEDSGLVPTGINLLGILASKLKTS